MSDLLCTSFEASIGLDRYPVVVSDSADTSILSYLSAFDHASIYIVADSFFKEPSNLPSHFYRQLLSNHAVFFVDGGVESKSIRALESICDGLFESSIPRDGLIVSLGGGVVGDLAAMASSIYQRGMKLIHIPTTTTSMFDSSIGGKTGINHKGQVNLLGTYHNPDALFCDSRFLQTLDSRDFSAGLCEAIKKSFISDAESVNFLKLKASSILSLEPLSLHKLICWCIQQKLFFVSSDFKESSTRLLLNYGHTFGQAFESFYGLYQSHLRHGEAVSLGLCCAAELSYSIFGNPTIRDTQRELLELYELPCSINQLNLPSIPSVEDLLPLLHNDKKRTSMGNRFVLLKDIGQPEICTDLSSVNLIDAFNSVL